MSRKRAVPVEPLAPPAARPREATAPITSGGRYTPEGALLERPTKRARPNTTDLAAQDPDEDVHPEREE